MSSYAMKPKAGLTTKRAKRATTAVKPTIILPALCSELRQLQKQRVANMKLRIMVHNGLAARVTVTLGYRAGLSEKERKAIHAKANAAIEAVSKTGSADVEPWVVPLIQAGSLGIDAFQAEIDAYSKDMARLARQLPVYEWTKHPDQAGFGDLNLAIVVGECGDLNNYPNPGKLWARMGCHPYTSSGVEKMAKTWRCSKPSLSAEEWEDYGYCPRRRAVAFNVGDPLIKQNGSGPYRRRYDQVKLACQAKHPEWKWSKCDKCHGEGCPKCYGTGKQCARAHMHAHLLMTKLLLKRLWIEWTGADPNFDKRWN